MAHSDEGSGKRNDGKISGGTRRIVVQDLPPEESPRARGRKLSTPAELDLPEQRTAYAPNTTQRTLPLQTPASLRTTLPSTHSPLVQKQSNKLNVKRLVILLGVIVLVPMLFVAIILLLPKPKKKLANKNLESAAAISAPSPASETASPATPDVTPSPVQNADTTLGGSAVTANEIRTMTVQLASQMSQKSGFEFAPEFVELIRSRTTEYSDQAALNNARRYRREINKSFRDEGLFPLVGYALAMSRSKFDSSATNKGTGIWQLPISVVRSQGYVGTNENATKLKEAETSAQMSASYTKQLLSTFDAEDFMYAIACFGMSLQEAGRLQGQLVRTAPDPKQRRDLMNMVRAGVLNSDQVDNIARFLAAGIVGENPQRFGLNNSESFSSLY
jgi:hypothetical protein